MDLQDSATPIAKEKVGITLPGHRPLIVAEAETHSGMRLWIEAVPAFNHSKTVVGVEFWLHVQRSLENSKHVTLTTGVIEQALVSKTSPCAAAMLDQYCWLEQNYPEISNVIYQSHQNRILPQAPSVPNEPL